MKRKIGWMLAIGMCLLAVAATARAETVYVSDVIKLSVRSGPGGEHKSIAVTESGQPVELIKSGEEWSLVRLANGAEGYVLARFLTTVQPGRFQYVQLQDKIKALTAQAAGLAEENSRLKAENERLAAAVSGGQKQIDSLRSEYETFKRKPTCSQPSWRKKTSSLPRLKPSPTMSTERPTCTGFSPGPPCSLPVF
jgi:SH3 domain protein